MVQIQNPTLKPYLNRCRLIQLQTYFYKSSTFLIVIIKTLDLVADLFYFYSSIHTLRVETDLALKF